MSNSSSTAAADHDQYGSIMEALAELKKKAISGHRLQLEMAFKNATWVLQA